MKSLSNYRHWVLTHEELFLALLRIYLGVGLFVKGLFLMANRDYLMQMVNQVPNMAFAPVAVAHYVIPAHLLGGILLALGLLTPIAALAQIPIMIGAVFYIYLPHAAQLEPRQNLEFSALVLFLLCLYAAFGGGRYSMDHYLMRQMEGAKEHGHELAGSHPIP